MKTCVHNLVNPTFDEAGLMDPSFNLEKETQCGSNSFSTLTSHGFLCFRHYKQQATAMPPRPRKPSRMYVKHPEMHLSEPAYIQRMLRLEADAIMLAMETGKIERLRFGKEEPAEIRFIL